MSKLTEFKNLLESFKADFQQLNENHGREVSYRPNEQTELLELYQKNITELKAKYKNEAEAICKKMLASEKYCDVSGINFDVLGKLSAIEDLGAVSKEIMLSVMADTYRSPSIATLEKMKAVLSKKNVNVVIPDPVQACEIIKVVADKVAKVVEEFDIDNPTQDITGSWIASLEDDFAKATTHDLKSTNKRDLYNAIESRVDLSALDSVVENYQRNYKSRVNR